MQWIKYQILQSVIGEESILVNKKVGYNEENLAIAEREAYDGYEIIDDEQSFEKEPMAIEFGGTGAKTAVDALSKLGAMPKNGGNFSGIAYASWENTDTPCLRNIEVKDAAGMVRQSTNLMVFLRK